VDTRGYLVKTRLDSAHDAAVLIGTEKRREKIRIREIKLIIINPYKKTLKNKGIKTMKLEKEFEL